VAVVARLVIVRLQLLMAIAITFMSQATELAAIAQEVIVIIVAGWLRVLILFK